MAEALAGALLASGFPKDRLAASDPDPARREIFEARLGISTSEDNNDAVAESDIVVIAVKPDRVRSTLARLKGDPERPLWISIAAGVTLDRLKAALSASARIVRAMPNTPAQVHAGATGFCPSSTATARALFESVGTVWQAPSEDLLDAVTGVSGSGPAYVFVFIEALADAGVCQGLPRDAAHALACQTVFGAAKLVIESGTHPALLKDRVASPGGTTIAGLERLEAGGLRAAIFQAVEGATQRSRSLRGPDQPGKGPR
ncbi:MAG: pyrroline-5-carboxylate reductase [Deltaproteobacteria bacterium]|nr:pyrroline-5-carboxylate reductase [Deltaproteobacteria bacterium]